MYLDEALKRVEAFASSDQLTTKIAKLETNLQNRLRDDVVTHLAGERVGDVLTATLAIKAVAGQINVVIHAIGILVSLPHVLEHNEKLQRLSLGAGNAGRSYDLEPIDRSPNSSSLPGGEEIQFVRTPRLSTYSILHPLIVPRGEFSTFSTRSIR